MKLLPTVLASSLLAFGTGSLGAQVVINEVNFKSGDQWIELYNPGSVAVKVGQWSIYHATKTPFRFGDYWWPFPATAEVKAKSYLRINWGKAIASNPPANTLNTGDSAWNFLFGHGFEELDADQGAIAVCTTQNNKEVNNANVFVDWWQWGDKGFKRESIAVNNKPTSLWSANTTLSKVATGKSLIVLANKLGFPHSLDSFDQDITPTPLAHNSLGASVTKDKKPCTWNTKDSELVGRGNAFFGSSSFKLVSTNTRGPAFFEAMFYIVRLDNQVLPYSICKDALSLKVNTTWWMTHFFPTTANETVVPIPLTDSFLKGQTVYVQSVVFTQLSFAFSNHLKVAVGQ